MATTATDKAQKPEERDPKSGVEVQAKPQKPQRGKDDKLKIFCGTANEP